MAVKLIKTRFFHLLLFIQSQPSLTTRVTRLAFKTAIKINDALTRALTLLWHRSSTRLENVCSLEFRRSNWINNGEVPTSTLRSKFHGKLININYFTFSADADVKKLLSQITLFAQIRSIRFTSKQCEGVAFFSRDIENQSIIKEFYLPKITTVVFCCHWTLKTELVWVKQTDWVSFKNNLNLSLPPSLRFGEP